MILGDSVNLRPVERRDAESIHAWYRDPELMRYWGRPVPSFSLNRVQSDIEQWLEDESRLERPAAVIIETLAGESIGLAVLHSVESIERSVELSIFIARSTDRSHGFGSDAMATLIDAAFYQWGLHRITARCEAFNTRAHQFFERHGFRLEGRLRAATFFDGSFHDVLIYGLLATDLDNRSAS